jgi:hypothetical protein
MRSAFETGDKPTASQFGTLLDSNSQRSFTPDVPGTYTFQLTVTDAIGRSCPSAATIPYCTPGRLLGTSPYALGGGDPINDLTYTAKKGKSGSASR